MATTWRDLPVEIVIIIYSLLDKKSRVNASSTCREWSDIYRNSVKLANFAFIDVGYNDDHMNRFLTKKRTRNGFQRFNYEEFDKMLASFPKLKSFLLQLGKDWIDSFFEFPMRLNCSKSPLLEKVTLNVELESYMSYSPNYLKIPGFMGAKKFTFCPKCKNGPLTSDDISDLCVFIDIYPELLTLLPKVAQRMKRLRCISFSVYQGSRSEEWKARIKELCRDAVNQVKATRHEVTNSGSDCSHQVTIEEFEYTVGFIRSSRLYFDYSPDVIFF